MYALDDTITAISTPPQLSAIAIVRISGPNAFFILEKIFKPSFRKEFPPKTAVTGAITDGKEVLDEVIVIKFAAPNSYTGEDLAEIHTHGNPFITQKLLHVITAFDGTRIAERGEFTYRAFINGKLDLTQAEAVLQVIESKSDTALKLGLGQLKGKLSILARDWKLQIVDILSIVEAQIDHGEDDIELSPKEVIKSKIVSLIGEMQKSLRKTGEYLTIEIPVVIVGKPNVGKSSLFNALAEEERVIVTPIAGTTTDIITETLHWDGLAWKVHDTAGIGTEAMDIIEKMGQEKTHLKLREAQIILFVIDSSEPTDAKDVEIAKKISQSENKMLVVVLNKSDKKADFKQTKYVEFVKARFGSETPVVAVSSITSEGISELRSLLTRLCLGLRDASEEIIVASVRQKRSITLALESLERAADTEPEELLAHHLRNAADNLKELLGEITREDILEEIFSKFCVGK